MIESITIKDDGKAVTFTPQGQPPGWATESGFTETVYLTPEATKRLREAATSADSNGDGYSATILRLISTRAKVRTWIEAAQTASPPAPERVNAYAAAITEKARGSRYTLRHEELAYARHCLRRYAEDHVNARAYTDLAQRLDAYGLDEAGLTALEGMRVRIALSHQTGLGPHITTLLERLRTERRV